jgi:hypothetical protein
MNTSDLFGALSKAGFSKALVYSSNPPLRLYNLLSVISSPLLANSLSHLMLYDVSFSSSTKSTMAIIWYK